MNIFYAYRISNMEALDKLIYIVQDKSKIKEEAFKILSKAMEYQCPNTK